MNIIAYLHLIQSYRISLKLYYLVQNSIHFVDNYFMNLPANPLTLSLNPPPSLPGGGGGGGRS